MSFRHVTILILILLLIYLTSSSTIKSNVEECVNSERIIGGICTSISERPFQALLFIESEPKCGGSIISKRWILTAAHCVRNVPVRYLTISVGSSRVGGSTAQYYDIALKIVHENFTANHSIVVNDIGLLRTSKRLEYNDRVRPIYLNRVTPEAGGETMVSGYGVTNIDEFSKTSEYLMSVDARVIGIDQCKSLLRNIEPQMKIPSGIFCAGDLNGGKDSCHGDSGGPVTIGNVLIGIVSWGFECGKKMMPAFHTDVSYYFDWILKNIRQNVCSTQRKRRRNNSHRSSKFMI